MTLRQARGVGIVGSFVLLAYLTYAGNAPNDEQARLLAAEAVAKATGVSLTTLTTKRMEGLEDNLFFSQEKVKGQIRRGAYFYKVEDGGWWITPDDVTYRAPSRNWYVAVSTTDGDTFGLFGFEHASDDFQRLVSKIPVEIKDGSEARIFAKFYVEVVYELRSNIVYDELWLEHQVEDHFVGYADSQESLTKKEQRFNHWWNDFKSKKIAQFEPTATAEDNNHFLVVMRILEMTIGHPPELWEWSMEIKKDGSTGLVRKRLVFGDGGR